MTTQGTKLKYLGLLLVVLAHAALAATAGYTVLPIAATDKQTYDARLAVGLTVDGGKSWQTSANTDQHVLIKGSIDPAPAHVNGKADIFVVELYNNQWTMLTPTGAWLPWNTVKIADLQPAREDQTLTATQEITIHDGSISTAGQHRIFIGYMPTAANSALIYSHTAASFQFNVAAADPLSYFEEEIFDDIVMTRCTLCHVDGGVADISDLHFIRDATLPGQNFAIFEAFYREQSDAFNYVLTKVTGGNGHVGGIQLPLGSTDYQKMAAFLGLLDGDTTVDTGNSLALFTGVANESATETLRDAALLLAGRLPTTVEMSAVANGGDTSLRSILPTLMTGTHFHQFLKDAANDRLFLRGNEDFNLADDCPVCLPGINAEYWRLQDLASSGSPGGRIVVQRYMAQLNYSLIEAPLELIAYVVENDRPYSEILTADYDLLTPVFNTASGGTAVFPAGTGPVALFQPGRVENYYLRSSSTQIQQVPGSPFPRVINPGNMKVTYPHVGVLNARSFLSRYPSTATNRNRARARWTWYNFLGVDIESLAKRTTDPVALADTNNPTMNNPSCAVCHSVLDPVAGTYQDYGDNGSYKVTLNGTDSLDRLYKTTQNGVPSLYRSGDTWYRDMREPGFDGDLATGTNTTHWLAEQIVNDERFATATVRFWWPAVIGAELLKAPEVATDLDYAARLAAYEAQQAEIETLTNGFVQSGLSLKHLLADLVMSKWYRAGSLGSGAETGVQAAARDLATLTGEKLLTPEQLARKTRALTGFNWYAQTDVITSTPLSGLENDYNTFYGGIDSFALKIRARTITPMMSNVAVAHALETSCPIVLGDFIRPDAQRLLFTGLSPWITPLTQAAATATMTSTSSTDFSSTALAVTLQPGANKVVLSVLNDACDYASAASQCQSNKNLVIGSVSILKPDGTTTTFTGNAASFGSCAAATTGNSLTLYSSCAAEYAFTADTVGTYTVTASLAARQTASDPVLAGLNVEASATPSGADTAGAAALKHKLVELHGKLLGQTVTVTSPEVLASYDLLVQTWQNRRSGNFTPSLLQSARSCDWSSDIAFIGTLSYPGSPLTAAGRYSTTAITTWLGPQAQDALYMKQSWVVVMVYLLSHYDYLHD